MRGERRALPAGLTADERALSQARRSVGLWQKSRADAADVASVDEASGVLLAFAYPDRIARARGRDARYLLANGRGAHLADPQPLSKAEFLIAAELDGAEREAKIFLAAPISLEQIERNCASLIVEHQEVRWDEREGAVRAVRERRLGAISLEARDWKDADPNAVHAAALSGLKRLGLAALPWSKELRQWQSRVMLMRAEEVPAPAPWPDLSQAALEADLEQWAAPWMDGLTRREHFARFPLAQALKARLSHAQSSILNAEAPTHFTVPSGSSIPIDYDDDTPSLSVRLQELFGLTTTPSVARGRVPLLLKMLSPAGRPVQITRDLVSFWDRGYHEVKKDLKGRYPKHYWPDDPHSAQATRRVRPRRDG
jgi:ATP-dependent helicase HrpB